MAEKEAQAEEEEAETERDSAGNKLSAWAAALEIYMKKLTRPALKSHGARGAPS